MKLSILLVLFGISQVFGGLQGIHGRNFQESGCRAAGCDMVWCRFQFPGGDPPPGFLYDLGFTGVKGLPIIFHTLYIRAISLVEFQIRQGLLDLMDRTLSASNKFESSIT